MYDHAANHHLVPFRRRAHRLGDVLLFLTLALLLLAAIGLTARSL
jgi:hypothetical protein